jgi:hypothetical protein
MLSKIFGRFGKKDAAEKEYADGNNNNNNSNNGGGLFSFGGALAYKVC